ncbi:putative Peptidase M14 carboxypeptidase A domain-containing protein [Seiridium unicorne]|uniref:Peptidase M14 carboxypeptidase A domain-containing protein n=1 Tax=Seiridium unicorne TaxID=138068 RepID=A0ABR2V209_9PEZI
MKTTLILGLLSLATFSQACLTADEKAGVVRRNGRVDRRANTGLAIGTGDRFSGGRIAPRGLGTQASSTDPGLILNVQEIESAVQGLATEYGIETFTTPYTTFENRSIHGGKAGGTGNNTDAYSVYINAGIHARERGGPDNLIYFISDLLYATKNNVGLTYGSKTYTAANVKTALSTGIVFVPLSNPDGVAYDQSSNSCWRKNRNTASATSGQAGTIGVDLNRNFDFLWDFPNLFAPSVASGTASTSPRAEDYHGTAAFSEPESKSIKWVLDTHANVGWFLDLHSDAGVVLYSWGSDDNQSKDSSMNFLNSTYDDTRGVSPDRSGLVYSEYTPATDWSLNLKTAKSIGAAMIAATGRKYSIEQASALYPTSGASDDYSYSRHFADPNLNLVHAFTVEFGFSNNQASCGFYPTAAQYKQSILETNAGFMELLLAAAANSAGAKGLELDHRHSRM